MSLFDTRAQIYVCTLSDTFQYSPRLYFTLPFSERPRPTVRIGEGRFHNTFCPLPITPLRFLDSFIIY